MECKYCHTTNANDFKMVRKGAQIGLYCIKCNNKWQKWVSKDEVRALIGIGVQQEETGGTLNMNEARCACGSTEFYTEQRGPHIGMFCKRCKSFYKWVKKK